MKSILITGGAGFIGSNLVEQLLDNYNIIIIDNFCDYYDPKIKEKNIREFKEKIKIYKEDIRNKEALNKIFNQNEIDCVIHLAGQAGVRQSIENPMLYQEVNCIGTQNILEEIKKHEIKKFILASSSSVYGNSKVPFKEDMKTDNPISPYAATKKSNEVLAYTYHNLYEINVMILRFFTVYGKRQRPDLAISKFTRQIINNEEIAMYGNGNTSRDYTYIDDIVNGIIKSMDYISKNDDVYEILNLGSSNPIKLIDMINTIGKILNKEPKIKKTKKQQGDVDITYANIDKAKELINYSPTISFEEGLKKYIDWYIKNNVKK